MSTLDEAVALVIGGGRGLGRAVALKLAELGIDLVLVSRTRDELHQVAEEVAAKGGEVLALPADVSREEDVAAVSARARQKFSQIDIVINCAGEAFLKDLPDVTVQDWDRIMDANLKSVFLVMREFLPSMMDRGAGQILNVSSRAGIHGLALASVYGAAKAGVHFLSRTWAKEASRRGVKVLALAPGPIDTPMRWEATPDFPRDRVMDADAVADLIVWIISRPDLTFEDAIIPVSINY